jgi:hypothetical protein
VCILDVLLPLLKHAPHEADFLLCNFIMFPHVVVHEPHCWALRPFAGAGGSGARAIDPLGANAKWGQLVL